MRLSMIFEVLVKSDPAYTEFVKIFDEVTKGSHLVLFPDWPKRSAAGSQRDNERHPLKT
jgi:hypothetical protein